MKICLVCSHGGHLTETLQILGALDGHDFFFAVYHGPRDQELERIARVFFTDDIGYNPFRMLRSIFWAFRILRDEKPDAILSLGAEIALPFFYLGRLLGIRTIYIESWCRVKDFSKTAILVYPVADVFLVQWPQLLNANLSKVQYHGSLA